MPSFLFAETDDFLVPGALHRLGTAALVYQLWDAQTPAQALEGGIVSVDPLTYDVRVTFAVPQSGRLVLLPATAPDTTPGSSTANAYCSVAEATALLQDHLAIEAWYTQAPEEGQTLMARREAALISATRLIDTQVTWYGRPATMTQALAWPQLGQVDRWGRPLDATTIPRFVQQATAYYALALLAATAADAAAQTGERIIKSKRIGDTEITYQDVPQATLIRAGVQSQAMPAEVRDLLRPYGTVPGLGMIPLYRT